ncbi:hypothetical protein LJR022_010033 [Paraburkholderia hospita]|uniref:hypothetical protein n=1 Tax=Paraburkholderia hospita TaxID=169430 RepID=UPI003ECC2C6F
MKALRAEGILEAVAPNPAPGHADFFDEIDWLAAYDGPRDATRAGTQVVGNATTDYVSSGPFGNGTADPQTGRQADT